MDPNLFRGDRRVTQRGTKGRPVHSPIGVEIRYQSEIRKLVAASDADVRAALGEYLDSWVQEYAALTGIRRDSWVDSLTSVFNSIVARMVGRLATEGPAIVRRASLETGRLHCKEVAGHGSCSVWGRRVQIGALAARTTGRVGGGEPGSDHPNADRPYRQDPRSGYQGSRRGHSFDRNRGAGTIRPRRRQGACQAHSPRPDF